MTVCSAGFLTRQRVERVTERLRKRRLEGAVGLVEEDREHAARPQHARDLAHGPRRRPNQWKASATKTASTDASSSGIASAVPCERLGLGDDPFEDGAHPVERLDREHAREPGDELPRQLPGAGGEVEYDRIGRQADGVERRLGVARPSMLVRLGRALEAAASSSLHTPARRKARLSRSISRAITRRCTSCVPS